MSRLDDRYEFDWLPGFREMMACQEGESDGIEESQMDGNRPEKKDISTFLTKYKDLTTVVAGLWIAYCAGCGNMLKSVTEILLIVHPWAG